MSIFDDPDVRQQKKINKVARNGAYSVGGGVGLWFMNALYPYEESAAHIARLFGNIAAVLLLYGVVVLAAVIFKRQYATRINLLMVWIVLPAVILFLFTKAWSGVP